MNESALATLQERLVESLYVEAVDLAENARGYFAAMGQLDRRELPPMARVMFSCESLKVTTRLMHAISWLLSQKAIAAGEASADDVADEGLLPVDAFNPTSAERLAALPEEARGLVVRTHDLYDRVTRLALQKSPVESSAEGPARALLSRLEMAF